MGYLTESTDAACTFLVLLCLYVWDAVANWLQHRLDSYFDTFFNQCEVHALRMFCLALVLASVFIAMAAD